MRLLVLLPLLWVSQAAVVSETLVAAPLTWRPDGVNFTGMVFNGQMPGPVLRAVKGDQMRIKVVNNLDEDTSLHFHGITQKSSIFADGVPYVTQCPIRPGESFEYVFTVEQAGTFWYHSHSGYQRGAGLFGALIVEDPDDPYKGEYDEELLLIIQDWFHHPLDKLMQAYLGELPDEVVEPWINPGPKVPLEEVGGGLFEPNGMLANGKHKFDCSKLPDQHPDNGTTCDETAGKYEVLHVKAGKRYRLRVIGASSALEYRLRIDQHEFNVMGTDGEPVALSPGTYASIWVTSGETYDLLLTADQPVGRYWLRACVPWADCRRGLPLPLAIISYEGADESKEPESLPAPGKEVDPFKLKAHATTEPPPQGWKQMVLESRKEWEVNGTQYMDEKIPLMFRWGYSAAEDYPIQAPIYSQPAGSAILLIYNNLSPINHPMHLHGHTAWLAGQGDIFDGPFDWEEDGDRLRLLPGEDAPIRKHSVLVRAESWIALLYEADNPGYWLFHCHLDPHMMVGMAAMLYDEPAAGQDPGKLFAIPTGMPTWCLPKTDDKEDGSGWVVTAVALAFAACVAVVLGLSFYKCLKARAEKHYSALN